MPNPADKKYENKKSLFISDCIRTRMKEGDSQEQAVGACYGIWENYKKKAAASYGDKDDEILFFEDEVDKNEK